jgi:hypothetical protein
VTEATTRKPTAKERYTQYFWEELEAHPDVPPSRTVIAKRMGWKSPNHSGVMPQIRRDLLTEAGFVLVGNRWHKGSFTFVDELRGVSVGMTVISSGGRRGTVESIGVVNPDLWKVTVQWENWATTISTLKELNELKTLPDLSNPESVEVWLDA